MTYELWTAIDGQNDSLLRAIRVTSTQDVELGEQRAIAAAKAHAKKEGYKGPMALYRADHSIAWEVA